MILTGKRIAEEIQAGRIQYDPFDQKHCNPNSVNFHLGGKLLRYKKPGYWRRLLGWLTGRPSWELSLRSRNETEEITIPPEGIVLQPGELYLGCTIEKIGSTHYAPLMAARSSIGRLGLYIYLNSGLGDIGFQGQWTLELHSIHPIRLHAGDRIGQMMFFEPRGEITQYSGKYQNSVGPVSSLIYRDDQVSSSVFKDDSECPQGPGCVYSKVEDSDSLLRPLQERFPGHRLSFVPIDNRAGWVKVELDGVVYDVEGCDRGVKHFEQKGTLIQILDSIENEIRQEMRRRMAEELIEEKCFHQIYESYLLRGGEGPDNTIERHRCNACPATRWKYEDGRLSKWENGV